MGCFESLFIGRCCGIFELVLSPFKGLWLAVFVLVWGCLVKPLG